ncbi:hypothetical protein [Methanobacterium sp.]|uniref:hypothetical protein n=1 Tax=Methanobacterium sp. TaxID=2164 RepID=UPI003C75B6D0
MENESFGEMFANILKNGFKRRQTLAIAIVVPIIVLIIIGYIVNNGWYRRTRNNRSNK